MSEFVADWYPDPVGRAELRYWSGHAWTDHIINSGVQGTDALVAPGQRESTIFNTSILVVRPHAIFDQSNRQLATFAEVSQVGVRERIRLLGNLDEFATTKLEVRDAAGRVILRLDRPYLDSRSKVIVSDAAGNEIGQMEQQVLSAKKNFTIQSGRHELGVMKAQSWRGFDFRIEDTNGTEIARVTKPSEDRNSASGGYVVDIRQRAVEPLQTLVVGSALGIDLALRYDS